MKQQILSFLEQLDAALIPIANDERLDLYHIGRSALVWKHGFSAATEDIDVVSPRGDRRLMNEAIRLFGKNTVKARELNLYLEEVPEGIPPVWSGCYMRAKEADEKWVVIRLFHLEDHDFAVTKLKRYSRKDEEDIRLMSDLGLLDPETLEKRVEAAWFLSHEKDEDQGREAAFANLKVVQRYLREGE